MQEVRASLVLFAFCGIIHPTPTSCRPPRQRRRAGEGLRPIKLSL